MRPRLPCYLFAALTACVLLFEAAWAQVLPFGGNIGPGLSPEDNQLLFASVARLNAAEPSQVGRSEGWSNPQTSNLWHLYHTPGVPLRWYGVPSGAPSHRRCRAGKGSRLSANLVSHVDRRVE